jgi:ankyrin repeat protein
MKKHVLISALLAVVFGISQAAFAGEIHDAVRAGDLAKVKILVAKDPGVVNEKDTRGRTPLHFASGSGNHEVISFLIVSGADINGGDDLGQTPLHLSAARGHRVTVNFLIAKGADRKAVCCDGRNLLYSAAAGGLVDLMDSLVKAGFLVEAPDRYGRTPLLKAAEAGSDAAVEPGRERHEPRLLSTDAAP